MTSWTRTLPALFFTALLPACASAPRVNPQTEEQAIRDLDRKWVQAIASKDVATITALYAPDGYLMPPNAAWATGAGIGSSTEEMLKTPDLSLTFEPTSVRVSQAGDMAYDVGTYRVSFNGPQGRVEDEGKYTTVWRKVDGQWRIASDIFNSNKPMAPPPAPVAAAAPPQMAEPMESDQPEVHAVSSLKWTDAKVPGFKPGIKLAVVQGDPGSTGPYTLRLRFPSGYAFPPHWHPKGEFLTVLQGTFMLGMGEQVDESALKTYRPGDFLYAPPKQAHFGRVKGPTTVQLHGTGPFQITVVNPAS